ncbi:MAG: hypothetical protein FWG63_03740 [Defluviitaleaceae bacterium]|nr:hypothetical protein [Defluviitaleaceae bacterium]
MILTTGKATGNLVEKITLDGLTENSVSIERQMHYTDGTESVPIGEAHRRAFVNSPSDRKNLNNYDIAENYIQAIFDVWGKTATLEDMENTYE